MKPARLPLPFAKMSGTGNDFILIDHRRPAIHPEAMADFARLVCRRRFSIGADGLILIENSDQADFGWRFFNADGSVAEMCGNGARCAARFAYMQGIAPARMRFSTLAGIIEASVADTEVSVRMTRPRDLRLDEPLEVNAESLTLHYVDTGVPHAVLLVDDAMEVDLRDLGSRIRYHDRFAPAGTNVNVVSLADDGLLVRTYERGVEGETLACGTGATAAALVAACKGLVKSPVPVTTSGGDRLTILFDLDDQFRADHVYLKGPALLIYRGEITPEALLGPGTEKP